MSEPQQPNQPYRAPMPPPGWGAAQPAPLVTGYPAAPAQQGPLAFVVCRFCGSVPAVNTTFHGHVGVLIVMRFLSTQGPFCRDCGLGVFRHMTSRTLVQGWYGFLSVIIAPGTILMNLIGRGKVARLAAPQPNPYGPSRPPMQPGPRLLQRPMTWIGFAIPIALLAFIILAETRRP